MNNDGKIYIIITDDRNGGKAPGLQPNVIQTTSSSGSSNSSGSNMVLSYAAHKFFGLIESEAKSTMLFSLHNVGNLTGDYIEQKDINRGLQSLNFLSSIGTAAIAGTTTFGPIGGIIAATVVTASKIFSSLRENRLNIIENNKVNYSIEQLRARAGLNVLTDGSRGTLD